ncbi:PREDICTED: methylesterase 10 [Tarenaya hassleriana]|uniref:methylesterase 10 n=1 Tax=Tarenaya hassleriana TaxID=28532 RepID=UPI00053C8F06|nr:PREDICTED: methylesterase 10 [Tarenaya hassleriana]
MQQRRYHFVLVHGSCHGAWCWFKVLAELRLAGHRVTAVDLGGSGVDPRRLEDVRSISDYLKPLIEFMSSLADNERVILVGHSFGGISISVAMERFPTKISAGVFISAYMPHHESPPAVLIQEYFKKLPDGFAMDCEFAFEDGPDKLPSSVLFGPGFLKEKAYRNCQLEDVELAMALMRPSRLYGTELGAQNLLTKERYGSVKRVYVISEGDDVMPDEFQRSMINNYEPDQVNVMTEAGHMAMVTKPKQLSHLLYEIAVKYN